MKVFRKVVGELRIYECSGRDMAAARAEVAACTTGGAILIDVGTIPPAPAIRASQYAPQFGIKAAPKFQ